MLDHGVNVNLGYFQYMIQKTLTDLSGVQSMADDIILHLKSVEEHHRRLIGILTRLKDVSIILNLAKCSFSLKSVSFFKLYSVGQRCVT